MSQEFEGIYKDLTVLITGHTGFKGSWLAIWLRELGARVVGYSLEPLSPSNFESCGLSKKMTHIIGDIRDYDKLKQVISQYRPVIIFHLAAQAIVLDSYSHPKATFEVNAQGTVNLLEAVRSCSSTKAVVLVTTDKCYENKEWSWGYRENDPLGGNDPYSASKAMAELAIKSYQRSFFNNQGPAIASVRAGNVIGGGDFSAFRIIPDTMKALMADEAIVIRNPNSVRPWFNVLDPLSGYLWLGTQLLQKGHPYAQAWNFGPKEQRGVPVKELVTKAIELWGYGNWRLASEHLSKPEMSLLRLSWDKAAHELEWEPVYHWIEALEETVQWFKAYQSGREMYEICIEHIDGYVRKASKSKLRWTGEENLMEMKSCALHTHL